jgi:hypothetical protein
MRGGQKPRVDGDRTFHLSRGGRGGDGGGISFLLRLAGTPCSVWVDYIHTDYEMEGKGQALERSVAEPSDHSFVYCCTDMLEISTSTKVEIGGRRGEGGVGHSEKLATAGK